jgi:uncharacterized protein YlzI (FlbEa/FlbD family)
MFIALNFIDGTPIWVNTANIIVVKPIPGQSLGTILQLVDGTSITVQETPAVVSALLP